MFFFFEFFTDVLLSEIIPRVLGHVRSLLSSNIEPLVSDVFESNPESQFWLNVIQAMSDSYAVERMSEQLLHQLASERVSDVEAYWILWLLFHRVSQYQISVRSVNIFPFLHPLLPGFIWSRNWFSRIGFFAINLDFFFGVVISEILDPSMWLLLCLWLHHQVGI